MKLLQKTNRLQLLFTAIILVVSSVVLLLLLRWMVNEELDEQLLLKAERQIQIVAEGHFSGDPLTVLTPVPEVKTGRRYADTMIYDHLSQENETYRQLSFDQNINGKPFHIWVATSRLEWEDFYTAIFGVFLGMALLLLIASLWIHRAVSRRLWAPFFDNLVIARKASVKSEESLRFEPSDIEEFQELKETLENHIAKARHDYRLLRTFADHASHEIQTPLAVILAKLDRLSQHPAMDEKMAETINSAREAAERLSRLNRNLLLLTRLENRQFDLEEHIPLTDRVQSHLAQMSELFDYEALSVHSRLSPAVQIIGNGFLTDTLIINLFSNVLRYADNGSTVEVVVEDNRLEVVNEAPPLPFEQEVLFARFQSGSDTTKGAGLGLAIVKEICEISKWQVEYTYEDGKHFFRVCFPV
ncbi:MAG: HAMP domain-containing sensor histidine kinase [Bacteroidia bacterium]